MLFNASLLQPLIDTAQNQPLQTLIYREKQMFNATDILSSSTNLAHNLYAEGCRKNDVLVIAAQPGFDFICIIYATIMLRCKVAIIDPEMGRELYRSKLFQLNPSWAFVDTRLLLLREHPVLRYVYFKLASKPIDFPRVKGLKIVGCGNWLPIFKKYIPFAELIKKNKIEKRAFLDDENDHDYLITYTSGTLDQPKGVVHSLNSLHASLQILNKIVNNGPGDIMATYLPHFALMGIGAQLPIFLYDANWSAVKKLNFFEANKITILFGPPSDFLPLIKYCVSNKRTFPATINHIMLGSAPVHKSFLIRLYEVLSPNCKVTIIYGMTEHLVISTVDGKEKMNYSGVGDLVGAVVKGVETQIAEDQELSIHSNQQFSGYFKSTDNPYFHKTGDLAQVDGLGRVLLKGRKKEMIIRGNTNIYPALYEDTIKKIPGIDEAAMVGIYDNEKEDERVFLILETSRVMTGKSVLEKISYGKFQIEKNALPDKIIFMKIPRKGRQQKIDRQKIINFITSGEV